MLKFIKKIKFAMTLGELLIVFVIMGIIAGMTMVTVKPSEKSLRYMYYRMYNSLGTAFYNTSINMDEDLQNDTHMDKNFPTTAELFCKMLLEYINTKDGTTASCSDDKTIDVDTPDFSDANVQFIASNGAKIWIGHSQGADKGSFSTYTGTDDSNSEFTLRYFWVFADLNGDMGPNSPTPRGSGMADIVAFIVTEDYDVIPIGNPEVDTRYFSAKVVYSFISGTGEEDLATSDPMAYLKAKRLAWGEPNKEFYVSANEPMSWNFYDGVNITAESPFWLDYNSEDLDSIMTEEVEENCRSNTPHLIDPEDPSKGIAFDVEADACYVTIQDFY